MTSADRLNEKMLLHCVFSTKDEVLVFFVSAPLASAMSVLFTCMLPAPAAILTPMLPLAFCRTCLLIVALLVEPTAKSKEPAATWLLFAVAWAWPVVLAMATGAMRAMPTAATMVRNFH